MLRKYSKISMFNILKTSLPLKMSNAYISNDMIIMLYHIIIQSIVYRFKYFFIENTETEYFYTRFKKATKITFSD